MQSDSSPERVSEIIIRSLRNRITEETAIRHLFTDVGALIATAAGYNQCWRMHHAKQVDYEELYKEGTVGDLIALFIKQEEPEETTCEQVRASLARRCNIDPSNITGNMPMGEIGDSDTCAVLVYDIGNEFGVEINPTLGPVMTFDELVSMIGEGKQKATAPA